MLKEENNEDSPLSKIMNKDNLLKEMNVESPQRRVRHQPSRLQHVAHYTSTNEVIYNDVLEQREVRKKVQQVEERIGEVKSSVMRKKKQMAIQQIWDEYESRKLESPLKYGKNSPSPDSRLPDSGASSPLRAFKTQGNGYKMSERKRQNTIRETIQERSEEVEDEKRAMIKPQTIQNNNNTLNMIAKRVVVFSQPRQNNIQTNANSASA